MTAAKKKKKASAKKRPKSRPVVRKIIGAKKAVAKKTDRDDLVVFAFRLQEDERQLIHDAAGPGKASEFARAVLGAAAREDIPLIKQILKEAGER